MKKQLAILLAALLVMVSSLPTFAADRVTKVVKTCKYTITDLAADAVLTKSDGTAWCDVSDMVVERVVLESNITALTGTNVIFKAITTSDPNNAGSTSDAALDGSDGSTDFVSATLTATGRAAKGTAVNVIGASGVTTNLGTKLGVWADTTSITDLDGFVYLTIFGKQ